ncbi:hypothetical protein ACN99C_26940 (plasmid) [Pseudomonas alloputida]|uniref:hypothetical protein n=1 Tax=Pseudomonas alloputida TaxID=1940621 RepID=UPI003B42A4C3
MAEQVGTTRHAIKRRREAFGLPPFTVAQAIAPFKPLLGTQSDRSIGARCGVSPAMVKAYRESQGILPLFRRKPRDQVLPLGHPLRAYKPLFGHVSDQEIARVSEVALATVQETREALGFEPVAPLLKASEPDPLPDYHGPLLGYESLLHCMSVAKISRAVGVPYTIIEKRRDFLGVKPFGRVSRVEQYKHLLGAIPHTLLAQLAGVSDSAVSALWRAKGLPLE